MLGHVSIHVADRNASTKFYLESLAPLSYKSTEFPKATGIGPSDSSVPIPCLWLHQHDLQEREKSGPIHISFYVDKRQQVDDFYARAIEAGGKSNGAPGKRPYMDNYYCTHSEAIQTSSVTDMRLEAAYVFDLDGNNIEAVCFKDN